VPAHSSPFDAPAALPNGLVEALLFDLGGVLVEFDWERAFAHWAERCAVPPARIRERFAIDDAFERYERGEIGDEEYFAMLRSTLGIELRNDDLRAGWNCIFTGAIAPTVDLLRRIDSRMPLYVFSNTNAAHHSAWSRDYAEALAPFRRIFTSHSVGCRKPERAAFERVAEAIGVPPDRILFFDDVSENVHGARAAGMQAVHVRSPADVASAVAPWLRR
jgi:putative hydrolase of the HAD superfamily